MITDETTAPDWQFWQHIPKVRLWQAVLLSLNVNPDGLRFNAGRIEGGPCVDDYFAKNIVASKRLRLLIANKPNEEHFSYCGGDTDPRLVHVRLSEFAAWALSVVAWEGLPPELVAMAQKREALTPEPSTPAKVGAGDTAADDTALPWAGEATSALPVTAKEIAAAFPVTWVDKWPERLKKAARGKSYQWLTGTVVHRGSRKPGDANTYNPAAVAAALALHGDMTRAACDAAIKRCFPAWLDEWNSKAEYLKS